MSETYRGVLAAAPFAADDVLVTCPTDLAFALPPNPPNPFPVAPGKYCSPRHRMP
jgi:hypothetical protein